MPRRLTLRHRISGRKKSPADAGLFLCCLYRANPEGEQSARKRGLHPHATHTAHAAHVAMAVAGVTGVFLRRFGNHCVGGQDQAGN